MINRSENQINIDNSMISYYKRCDDEILNSFKSRPLES